MEKITSLYSLFIEKLKCIDWLGPLALRLYLAPIFIGVGAHKFANWDDMVAWFGNPDWGLGLPMPAVMVFFGRQCRAVWWFGAVSWRGNQTGCDSTDDDHDRRCWNRPLE